MHQFIGWLAVVSVAGILAGCETTPPEDIGPNKTEAYYVQVESSVPGVVIETNNAVAGTTPLTLKIFGDSPGNFHNFGSPEYRMRAIPPFTNGDEIVQTRVFKTGHSGSGDRIPGVIFFNMNQQSGAVLIDSLGK
jgi:hypothetical protein